MEFASPGNHIDRSARHGELPHRADEVRVGAAALLHGEHHFGGRGGGIVAQRHGHGAGMPGEAGDGHGAADATGDAGDHAHRQIRIEQHRPLFDVHLDEAQHPGGIACDCGDGRRVAARRRMASRSDVPCASTLSSICGSKRPASARLPRKVDLKRTPSSSANAMISSGYGSRTPARRNAPATAIGSTTPSRPSYLPALMTVS
jgi:hypothetical protein